MDFVGVAELCAPNVHVDTLHRIAAVESSFNPFAIGVVGGRLERQPRSLAEAVATAQSLETQGYNYSLGLVQVNRKNFGRYGLSLETAFDPCQNLRAGAAILEDCFRRALGRQRALTDAFSCYYSGTFTAGYKLGYVDRITAAPSPSLADYRPVTIPIVPMLGRSSEASRPARTAIATTSRGNEQPADPLFVSFGSAPIPSTPPAPSTALLF